MILLRISKSGRYRLRMNWSGKGFLGVYAEWLEPPPPEKPENKAETLRALRETHAALLRIVAFVRTRCYRCRMNWSGKGFLGIYREWFERPPPSALRHQAFTLVEITVVLMIIGLIVGGITVGIHLVRAAALQKVVTQVTDYAKAFQQFKDKYHYLPGDIPNATTYWGQVSGGCTYQTGTGTQTCNGNGDNALAAAFATSYEPLRAWQHLANAGYIRGRFRGAPANSANCTLTAGTDVPEAIYNGFWLPWSVVSSNSPNTGYSCASNSFWIGSGNPAGWPTLRGIYLGLVTTTKWVPNQPTAGVLTPSEARMLDSKIDDGVPAYGKVITLGGVPCVSNDSNPATAAYDTTSSLQNCLLFFRVY